MDKLLKESARFIKALSNPYRLRIVRLLRDGEMNVAAINRTVKVSQPSLSQHLAKLKRIGIVESRRDKTAVFYKLKSPHALRILDAALDSVNPVKA